MIKHMQHEPKRFDCSSNYCKYCGCILLFDGKRYSPQFTIKCITEDEYIIKSIILKECLTANEKIVKDIIE